MTAAISSASLAVYTFLLPIAQVSLVVAVLILVPMAFFQGTKKPAGVGLLWASYLLGATTWTLGAAITFSIYSWLGLAVGMLFFGVGVVALAILGSVFVIKSASMAISLIVMAILVWGFRAWGVALMIALPGGE